MEANPDTKRFDLNAGSNHHHPSNEGELTASSLCTTGFFCQASYGTDAHLHSKHPRDPDVDGHFLCTMDFCSAKLIRAKNHWYSPSHDDGPVPHQIHMNECRSDDSFRVRCLWYDMCGDKEVESERILCHKHKLRSVRSRYSGFKGYSSKRSLLASGIKLAISKRNIKFENVYHNGQNQDISFA